MCHVVDHVTAAGMMATSTTPQPPDPVQCPVCFKDFTSATINPHLDACLLESTACEPEMEPGTSGEEPPLKKPRGSAADASARRPAAPPPPGVFSLFHADRSKVSDSGGPGHVRKGIKRDLPMEPGPGAALMMSKPLADALRPDTLEDYFGQGRVVGERTLFRSLLEAQEIPSFILWGPPGCGKVGSLYWTPWAGWGFRMEIVAPRLLRTDPEWS